MKGCLLDVSLVINQIIHILMFINVSNVNLEACMMSYAKCQLIASLVLDKKIFASIKFSNLSAIFATNTKTTTKTNFSFHYQIGTTESH